MRDFEQIRVYKWVMIQCHKNRYVSLKAIEEHFPQLKDRIFSYMQWNDVKCFQSSSVSGCYEIAHEFKSPEGYKLAMERIIHLGNYQ